MILLMHCFPPIAPFTFTGVLACPTLVKVLRSKNSSFQFEIGELDYFLKTFLAENLRENKMFSNKPQGTISSSKA